MAIPKVYHFSSSICGLPAEHRPANWSSQCCVAIRATSQARAASLAGTTPGYLRSMAYVVSPELETVVEGTDVLYYQVNKFDSPDYGKWFKAPPQPVLPPTPPKPKDTFCKPPEQWWMVSHGHFGHTGSVGVVYVHRYNDKSVWYSHNKDREEAFLCEKRSSGNYLFLRTQEEVEKWIKTEIKYARERARILLEGTYALEATGKSMFGPEFSAIP